MGLYREKRDLLERLTGVVQFVYKWLMDSFRSLVVVQYTRLKVPTDLPYG